jgi:catechol-2,3-dioxygenase
MTTDDAAATDDRTGAVRGPGEFAFRTENLDEMAAFYGDVVGLDEMERSETSAFFGVAEGYGGHTQVLVLFDRSAAEGYEGIDSAATTVDHVAFEGDRDDFDAEAERLADAGLDLDFAYHDWVSWRSLYVADPDGNRVEFVCHDPDAAE